MFLTRTVAIFLSPLISETTLFQRNSIFGFSNAFSWRILLARSVSRRCTTLTDLPNFVRNVASSSAVSPPPTTTMSSPLKNGPSHVAQYDTPLPLNCCSAAMPSLRGRSEEHTSELQSRGHLVCRLLLE